MKTRLAVATALQFCRRNGLYPGISADSGYDDVGITMATATAAIPAWL